MGKGIDLARGDAPIHAAVLDDFKDQLLIVLIKRLQLATKEQVVIPVEEIDATGQDLLAFQVVSREFRFELRKKS
jgi:hypothetical protein